MELTELKKWRDKLFTENFKPKTSNIEEIVNFCKELSNITGIQVCTDDGLIYEYLPQVYKSVVK